MMHIHPWMFLALASLTLAMAQFLQASRFGRYSGSSTTSLNEDLRDVHEAGTLREAVDKLLRRFRHEDPIEPEDFMRDYGDSRFGRFLLYLLIYDNKALDWDEHSHRVGFEGAEVFADFRPQWHHVFPKKCLEGAAANRQTGSLGHSQGYATPAPAERSARIGTA